MAKAEFLLSAFMVDNDVAERAATIFRFRMANMRHLRRKAMRRTALVSRNRWMLDDASIIGIPDIDERAAAMVFAVALTVQSWRTIQSPVILSTVSVLSVEKQSMFGEIGTKLTSPPVIIDEVAFVDAAKALSTKSVWKGSDKRVMREAVNSYWDALHSVHRRSRYQHLWAAFEKLANIDARSKLRGKAFDLHAAPLAKAKPSDVRWLCNLNNWLKHPQKKPPQGADNIGKAAGELKRLLDQCLAGRFAFNLSSTYAR